MGKREEQEARTVLVDYHAPCPASNKLNSSLLMNSVSSKARTLGPGRMRLDPFSGRLEKAAGPAKLLLIRNTDRNRAAD